MTYQSLLDELKTLTPEQLTHEVMVHLTDGDLFTPIHAVCLAVEGEHPLTQTDQVVLGG